MYSFPARLSSVWAGAPRAADVSGRPGRVRGYTRPVVGAVLALGAGPPFPLRGKVVGIPPPGACGVGPSVPVRSSAPLRAVAPGSVGCRRAPSQRVIDALSWPLTLGVSGVVLFFLAGRPEATPSAPCGRGSVAPASGVLVGRWNVPLPLARLKKEKKSETLTYDS